jgi:hypothetical protein
LTISLLVGCSSSKDTIVNETETVSIRETEAKTEQQETELLVELETEIETESETEPVYSDTVIEVQTHFQETIDEAKRQGLVQDRMYLNVYLNLSSLRSTIQSGKTIEDFPRAAQNHFGVDVETTEELVELIDDTLAFMVDKGEDYLSPFAKKMQELDSIQGDFSPEEVSFVIDDMQLFLSEIKLSSENFGKILAMVDCYAATVEFTETGLIFHWVSRTPYRLEI